MRFQAIGYLPKVISPRPEWLEDSRVSRICSVSNCVSRDPADETVPRNAWYLFDRPGDAVQAVRQLGYFVFGYCLLDIAFEDGRHVAPRFRSTCAVPIPTGWEFLGHDIVSQDLTDYFECSPLSCNLLSVDYAVNEYCLIDSLEESIRAAENFSRGGCEPGTYYVVQVYARPGFGTDRQAEGGDAERRGHPG